MRHSSTLALVCLLAAAAPAGAAPDAPVALDWQAIGRASVLGWTTPGGEPVAGYEVRGSPRPIDGASFDAASPLAFFPSGTPRPGGILELRELEEVEVGEDEEPPTVLDDALYFAVRALDAAGAAGPVAVTDGFELVRLRTKTNRAGLVTLVLKGRFATGRAGLELGSGDLRVRVLQGDVTVLDETVPAAAFPPSSKPVRIRNRLGPLRLVAVSGGMFARLTVKTTRLPLVVEAGDVAVLVDLGDRPFAAAATWQAKGRRLVAP
jgi:hypothetical protein